jgi:hypothetical protein
MPKGIEAQDDPPPLATVPDRARHAREPQQERRQPFCWTAGRLVHHGQARPAGDRRMAGDGVFLDATIAVIAKPWHGPSYRPRNHGAVRGRDACLGDRGCAALIRLTITPAAFAVIVATMPESVGKQNSAPNGEFYVWLEPKYVERLRALRKPGESYSDVILRMAEASEGGE